MLSSIWFRMLSIFISSAVDIACINGMWLAALFCGELSNALEPPFMMSSSPAWPPRGELILQDRRLETLFEFTYSCCLTCCCAEGAMTKRPLFVFWPVRCPWPCEDAPAIPSIKACCSAALVPNCSGLCALLPPDPAPACIWFCVFLSSRSCAMIGVGAAR